MIAGVLLLCCLPGQGQGQGQGQSRRNKTPSTRLAAERKKQAQSLLIALAGEVRSFQDQTLRARLLARIAEALWEADAEQGRSLFIKSWEAADSADASDSEKSSQRSTNVRRDTLVVIAQRDRVLAEELLEKLRADETANAKGATESTPWTLQNALQQRLDLADRLLRAGDTQRAAEFADPALSNVTVSTIDFLTVLRDKDPAAADARYARLLQQAAVNQSADANTVSLLAAYVFFPRLYLFYDEEGAGGGSWQTPQPPPANVSPELRLMFFKTAAEIMLRPLPPPNSEQVAALVPARFMLMRRLMPLFDQFAPRELTDQIQAQFEVLNSQVSERLREAEDELTERGITPEKTDVEQQQSLLDQIERAGSSDERDYLYFKLASLAAGREDSDARNYVSRIADTDFRKQAQQWIDWELAGRAVKRKNVDVALEIIRTSEMSHIQQVLILTRCARLVDRERASTLLDEATAAARRLDSLEDRARALLAIANSMSAVDPVRVWETLFEAVKAANSSDTFNGDNGILPLSLRTKHEIYMSNDSFPEFEIKGVFGEVAGKDFDRAVQLAHGFQRGPARANATIAICRAVLNERQTTPGSKSSPAAKK